MSIETVAVCADSTLPATSVEKNEIVWTPSPETLTLVPLFQPPPSTAYWCSRRRSRRRSRSGDGDRARLPTARRVVAGRGSRVVDAASGDDVRHRHVAGDVGHLDRQVVDAVGDVGRRPGGRGRAGLGAGVVVDDGGDARAARVVCGRREVDGAAEVRARVVQDRDRRRVVDAARADAGAPRRVAGDVGRLRAEEVEAVGEARRVERELVRVGVVDRAGQRRPRAAVDAVLELDLRDARAGVGGRALQRDGRARFAPGSSSAVAGGELSMRRSSTGADSVRLPALSVTTTRRS